MKYPLLGFLSDLSTKDNAVALCKGLMYSVHPEATIIDITHEVTPFDINEGALYLADIPEFFPAGSVFACVVFPETGTDLGTIALRNKKGQLFIASNNGLLTRVIKKSGISEVYEVTNEAVIHPRTSFSYTFYGLDVVVSCAAHLSAGFPLEKVGKKLSPDQVVLLDEAEPVIKDKNEIHGQVSIIDKNFGNVWTNIHMSHIFDNGVEYGETFHTTIGKEPVVLPFSKTFGDVPPNQPLAYINSRGYLAMGLNCGNFCEQINAAKGMAIKLKRGVN